MRLTKRQQDSQDPEEEFFMQTRKTSLQTRKTSLQTLLQTRKTILQTRKTYLQTSSLMHILLSSLRWTHFLLLFFFVVLNRLYLTWRHLKKIQLASTCELMRYLISISIVMCPL